MAAVWLPTSLSNFLQDATASMFATLMMFANDTTTTTSAATAAGARPSPQMDPAGIFFYDGADGCITNDGGSGIAGSATKQEEEEKKKTTKNKGDHDPDYEAEYKQLARDELEDMLLTGELPDFASGQARCNERKNRYSNNLPLERTRVKLAPRPHTPGSDYINASYIHAPASAAGAQAEECSGGAGEDAEYIAAQAPLAGTCGDFWRMVAERGAGLVVMLTRLREGERTKATRYWPRRVGRTTRFGEVRVRLVSVHSHYGPARDDLIVRRFLIRRVRVQQQQQQQLNPQQPPRDDMHDDGDHGGGYYDNSDNDAMASEESEVEGEEGGEGEWREVVHLHYQAWPDFGRPATDSFRALLRLVDDFHVAHAGPVVTHCSAGLGRTGVLIAAHIALAQLRRTAAAAAAAEVVRPDVYATVRHIRKQRPGMVQTLEQFAFIHEVVNDLLAERKAAASITTTTTTTTDTTVAATTTSRARASASTHTATKRCSSSPPRISSGRSSTRGGGAFSSLGWSATAAPSASSGCCALVDDLMDYEATISCAAELGLASAHHHHQAAARREQQRGRQGLCSSTPAICMRV